MMVHSEETQLPSPQFVMDPRVPGRRQPRPHTRSPHHFAQYLTSGSRLFDRQPKTKDYGTQESCRGIKGSARSDWDMLPKGWQWRSVTGIAVIDDELQTLL